MNLPAVQTGGALLPAAHQRTRAVRDSQPRPPVRFGGWRPTRWLKRGERNDVFRARLGDHDLGPGCYVLKTPRREGDPIGEALLRRETLVAREVAHPNLTAVLASERGARPCVVFPYCEGITLRQWLRYAARSEVTRSGQALVTVATALAIARQVASASAALHQAGWLHGQIKPEHIVVSPQGQATLLDLSQARQLDHAECETGGSYLASRSYAAPEWSLARARLTGASDTYALGLVLFELLTLQPLFAAGEPRQLATFHRTAAPPDLRRQRPDASLECAELVRRMLANEPLRRPSDKELVRWLAEIEIAELAI